MKIKQSALKQIIFEEIQSMLLEITAAELAQVEGHPLHKKPFQGDPKNHPEYETQVPTYSQDSEIDQLIDAVVELGDMYKIKTFLSTLDRTMKSINITVSDTPTGGGGFEIQHINV